MGDWGGGVGEWEGEEGEAHYDDAQVSCHGLHLVSLLSFCPVRSFLSCQQQNFSLQQEERPKRLLYLEVQRAENF
jgi:hypothetical protein